MESVESGEGGRRFGERGRRLGEWEPEARSMVRRCWQVVFRKKEIRCYDLQTKIENLAEAPGFARAKNYR